MKTAIGTQVVAGVLLAPLVCVIGADLQVPADYPAISDALASAKAGDRVVVSAGVYEERIEVPPGVTLRSAGDDSAGVRGLARAERTIIDGKGGEEGRPGVLMSLGAVLDGFTITGVGNYDEARWRRHHETRGRLQSHEHIGGSGIAGVAIAATCEVRGNIVHHLGYTGISVRGSNCSALIVSNVCHRNMGGGIGALQGAAAVIRGNTCFENLHAGIGHDNASPLVEFNRCFDNIRAGIGVSEGACPVVRSNLCYRNRRAGIGVRTGAGTRPLLEGNDCHDNGMAGIGVDEHAEPTLVGNRCYRNQAAGIGTRGGAAPRILRNECFENADAGIGLMSGRDTLVEGNHSHHNRKAGIGFAGREAGKASAVVRENRLIENGTVAVGINPGWKVLFERNEFRRSKSLPPLIMVFENVEATFVENRFFGNGVAGIRTAGTVDVRANEFTGEAPRRVGPPQFGVWALPGSEVSMTGNRIQHLRHALFARNASVSARDNSVHNCVGFAFRLKNPATPPRISNNLVVGLSARELLVE